MILESRPARGAFLNTCSQVMGTSMRLLPSASVLLAIALSAAPVAAQVGTYSTFGTGCQSASFTNHGVPVIGHSFDLVLSHAVKPPQLPLAVLHFGISKKMWGPIPLPFDLTPFGAKGCQILTSGEFAIRPIPTTPKQVRVTIPIPVDRRLVGIEFFNQFIVLSPHNNGLNVATTNGGQGRIGASAR